MKPELELRHGLLILLRQLRTLRTRPDHGHLPAEDVEQLGQFVQPAPAEHTSHTGDAVVILPCQLRPVLLCIHHHTAELIDIELFAPQRQTLLPEQHRPAVVQLDGKGTDQHDRREQYGKYHSKCQVERTLDQPLFHRQTVVPAQQQRRIEQPDFLRSAQDDVGDLRGDIGADVSGEAVLEQVVAPLSGDLAQDHAFIPSDRRTDLLGGFRNAHGLTDHILVHTAAHFQHQLGGVLVAVDDDQMAWRIDAEVQPVHQHHPQHQHQQVVPREDHHGERGGKVTVDHGSRTYPSASDSLPSARRTPC